MVQLTLPRNSRKTGKIWNRPESKGKWKEFGVYRWNSEDGENPRLDTYWVDLKTCRPMILDGLIKIKNGHGSCAAVRPLLTHQWPDLLGPDHWHPRAYKTHTLRTRRRQIGSRFPQLS